MEAADLRDPETDVQVEGRRQAGVRQCPKHEVTALVAEVVAAIQHVADRGVIYAEEDRPAPHEYGRGRRLSEFSERMGGRVAGRPANAPSG